MTWFITWRMKRTTPGIRASAASRVSAPVVLTVLLVTAGCTSTASRVTTTYYNISGMSGAELDKEIAAKGPMKGHALASAEIRLVPVSVEYEKGERSCRFHRARFRVDANVTLPRWRQQIASRDRELRSAWNFISTYARKHEQEHIRIAEKYARKAEEDLMAIPPKPDCDRLEAAAERTLKRNRTAHDREQNAFDAREQKRLAKLFE
ncbi:DUF922 domain-containing protein [Oricola cellulosilytica]|nr:DUF922 domain-containing protein [Oricola cellulosilytica]